MGGEAHWQETYESHAPTDVSWYEADPSTSLRCISQTRHAGAQSAIDVGGGSSNLVDRLLDLSLDRVAVLDISASALAVSKHRLGRRADRVDWITGDIRTIEDVGRSDVWHDRALFHFLTDEKDRRRYVELAERTVPSGGTAIVATFSLDGPTRCSGLDVCRYAAPDLAQAFAPGFDLLASEDHAHITPSGITQPFVYVSLRRR